MIKIKSQVFSFITTFRIENIFKNLLIFLPLLLSERLVAYQDVIMLVLGFFIFSTMTSICYVTNDFTDQKKDLLNKLKSKKKILKKNTIIFLNIFLIILLILLNQFTSLFNSYLFIYLICFNLYNFLIKKFFLIDIIFLTSFYIIRMLYGSELIDLDISYWFLLFFISFFLIFSTFKRMIQISVNKLKTKKNRIINYSLSDYSWLKKLVIFSAIINFFTASLYLYELSSPSTFNFLSAPETRYEQSIVFLLIFFLSYVAILSRIISLVFKQKIKQDIYIFALNDKFNYVLIISYLLFVYFHIN
ncbi:4-hydroxybenzoate polyprenyltransferase [Candidatus Pelagibacter ubique]|uniref:4-hydroxybenzoate polyprenyltransferase n=1 Tax=Pelagibacter ubique TaxID=198252 RepID=A0ABX1T2N1_PELUQ|nr:hypothetical protein [Candidatus Pelagibacter ubique]NMN67862.1 4-hydroxybenzoate polyprenyltransferase [Candidatus Pelagibacter ubique]